MRVLVLGGTGFIGRMLLPQLQRAGHTVGVFHRGARPVELPAGITELTGDRHRLDQHAAELRGFAPDVVIDMIASSGGHGAALVRTFRGVARWTVVLSSVDVYRAAAVLHGLEAGPLEPVPLREDSALRSAEATYPAAQLQMLQAVFGWLDGAYDKVAVEHAVQADPSLPATVLRLPMIYGPGDPLHRFWPLVKRVQDGRPRILLEEQVARWRSPRGYVENVAAAIALAATSDRALGRTYNVAEPDALTELEWARLVTDAMGWRGQLVVVPTARAPRHLLVPGNLDQHWVADSSRIRTELGFAESVPRAEAIRRTVEWEGAHPPPTDAAQFDYAAEDAV